MNATSADRAAIVRDFIDRVWNGGDSAAIDRFVDADFVDRAYDPPNAEGHARMVEMLKQVVPDAAWTIDRLAAQDQTVLCELTLTGTHRGAFSGHKPKGNVVRVRAYRTFVFDAGKIIEHAALLDTSTLLKQMAGAPGS